jgi:hypothetical protein
MRKGKRISVNISYLFVIFQGKRTKLRDKFFEILHIVSRINPAFLKT